MSQVQRQRKPYSQNPMETNYCEFASLIGHEALYEGELREVPFGYDYKGKDDRGLPVYFVDEELGEFYLLEGVCL